MGDPRLPEFVTVCHARLMMAANRLRDAKKELDAAEFEHRMATEAMDQVEREYYRQPLNSNASTSSGDK